MKKILITLIGFVSLTILFGNTLQAKADSLASVPTVEAKITSAEGVVGEGSTLTKVIEHKELAYLSKFSTVPALEEKKYETTIEVEYYFTPEESGSTSISPLSTNTGSANNGIAKSSITLTYWISGNTIKVEKCHGSWSKASTSSIIVSDRYVTYRGPNAQQTAWKYPTSNTFSYNTGWGYASQNTAGNGRAYMSAYTSISGMGRLFLEAALNL